MFTRWRHKRGFGVHSPFGYEVVTRALFPRHCSWYGYRAIDRAFGADPDPAMWRMARITLRLAAMLQPSSAFLPAAAHKAFAAALRAADSKIRIERNPCNAAECQMICASAAEIGLDAAVDALRIPGHWAILRNVPPEWMQTIERELPEGIIFFGSENIIAFHRPDTQKIAYEVPID